MSGIFGVAAFDGRPFPPDLESTLRARARRWHPDRVSTAAADAAIFGHSLVVQTEDERTAPMPLIAEASGALITAAGRLDNRDELLAALSESGDSAMPPADSTLVARAYRRWGENAPLHLYGDWMLAAWDPALRRLFLARDRLGNTFLYYWRRGPLVAFASDIDVLFAVPEIPRRLDEEQLARYLLLVPGELDRAAFEDVRVLRPARRMVAEAERTHVSAYWQPEDAPAVHCASDAEYLEGFRHHFRRAVRSRLRTDRGVAVTLSSGLDSSSVAAVAAELMGERASIPAFTSVPVHAPDARGRRLTADESPLAGLVAARWPALRHERITAEDRSPVRAIEEFVGLVTVPVVATANAFWIFEVLRATQAAGAGVLLTGQIGNGTISWSGGTHRVFFLLASGRIGEALRELRRWKRRHGVDWLRTVHRYVVVPWRSRRQSPAQEQAALRARAGTIGIAPAVFERLVREGRLAQNPEVPLGEALPPHRERIAMLTLNGLASGLVWHPLGSAFRLDVRDPTADARLLEYCLGLPERLCVEDGLDRMVVRRAMEGRLPDEVRLVTRRGAQASDLVNRLAHFAPDVEAALDRLEASALARNYLDVATLRRAWARVPADTWASVKAAQVLLSGLCAGFFLVGLEATAAPAPAPVTTG